MVKFTLPTVVNGKVYVATSNSLAVYGLFPTPKLPPSAPNRLSATGTTPSQITLSWADSAHDNKGYLIQQSTDGMNFTQVGTAPANATSFSVTGLQPGTTYSFRMCAFNSVGNSAFTGTATATTPATAAPAALTSHRASAGRAAFSRSTVCRRAFKVRRYS